MERLALGFRGDIRQRGGWREHAGKVFRRTVMGRRWSGRASYRGDRGCEKAMAAWQGRASQRVA